MNIMISFNDNYFRMTEVMIYSLFKNHPETEIHVYLLYTNLKPEYMAEFQQLFEKFSNKSLHLLSMDSNMHKNVSVTGPYSIESVFRLIGLNLLPADIHRILWLDSDIIINGNLLDLYNTELSDSPFAVCEDIKAVINCEADDLKQICGTPLDRKYFNSGVLLMNLDYIRLHHLDTLIRDVIFAEFENYPLLDQSILNRLFFDSVTYVPWSLYNVHPLRYMLNLNKLSENRIQFLTYREINEQSGSEDYKRNTLDLSEKIRDNARIIHYIGPSKPWLHRNQEMYITHVPFRHVWEGYEKELLSVFPEYQADW